MGKGVSVICSLVGMVAAIHGAAVKVPNARPGHPWPGVRKRSGRWWRPLDALPHPPHALRRVLEQDAFAGELVADGVGAGEISRLLGRGAFLDQGLDADVVLARGAPCEPFVRLLLQ